MAQTTRRQVTPPATHDRGPAARIVRASLRDSASGAEDAAGQEVGGFQAHQVVLGAGLGAAGGDEPVRVAEAGGLPGGADAAGACETGLRHSACPGTAGGFL